LADLPFAANDTLPALVTKYGQGISAQIVADVTEINENSAVFAAKMKVLLTAVQHVPMENQNPRVGNSKASSE
jgi:hypothetical protein